MHLITAAILYSLLAPMCGSNPWYLPLQWWGNAYEASETETIASRCAQDCVTTMDCSNGLSCFYATSDTKGCCLMALKPNETGCVLDDQCRRACESTVCERTSKGSRCMCEKGRHFLFNKCWKKCPEFAFSEPIVDELGFSRCALKTDLKTAATFMRRFRREMKKHFC